MNKLLAVILSASAITAAQAQNRGQAEHVVVLVWDGLRPDFVTPQFTPTLFELAKRGTFFMNHHSAYVTSTEVNGTALATGMQPDHSGIIANVIYQPEVSWLNTYGTESLDALRRADLATGGHYLPVATVPEILHGAGVRTVVAGAKPVTLLHDRATKKLTDAEKQSVTLFRGQSLPRAVMESLANSRDIGPFPGSAAPFGFDRGGLGNSSSADRTRRGTGAGLSSTNALSPVLPAGPAPTAPTGTFESEAPPRNSVDAWTTKALVRGLWRSGVPKYSLLWLSEPDATQHATGVGSDAALAALSSSDDQLAAVLKALQDKEVLEHTDIFVVSDHGFSTVNRGSDVIEALKKAKFKAGRQFDNPEAGDILVNNLGGSTFFYVFENEETVIRRLVAFLQGTDFAGVIFSKLEIEGTFPLSLVHLNATNGAPDVVVSMRWDAGVNEHGAPGQLTILDGRPGTGSHGSLSRYDLHNTLIAAGPDFEKGFVSFVPSGNVDVAPTVLSILGVEPPARMDGRVLAEALVGRPRTSAKPITEVREATRDLGFLTWNQYLKITRIGYTVYYEEGNGRSELKSAMAADNAGLSR